MGQKDPGPLIGTGRELDHTPNSKVAPGQQVLTCFLIGRAPGDGGGTRCRALPGDLRDAFPGPGARCVFVSVLDRRRGRGGRRRILRRMTKPAAPKRHLPTSPFKAPVAPAPKHFAVGDQVTHDMYGLGRVIGVEDGIAVLVDFGSSQMRILSPYSKMTKL